MKTHKPIQTVHERARAEFVERKSRFIATVTPVASKDEVTAYLTVLRREFPDATHHCYAYRLSPDGLQYRFADDGEPSGTAGKPILMALIKRDLVDTLLVVTRYFGGVKLGAGPLARAYATSAGLVLDSAEIITRHSTEQLRVFTTYEDMSAVRSVVEKYAVAFSEEFGDVIFYTVSVRTDQLPEFSRELADSSQGRAGTLTVK